MSESERSKLPGPVKKLLTDPELRPTLEEFAQGRSNNHTGHAEPLRKWTALYLFVVRNFKYLHCSSALVESCHGIASNYTRSRPAAQLQSVSGHVRVKINNEVYTWNTHLPLKEWQKALPKGSQQNHAIPVYFKNTVAVTDETFNALEQRADALLDWLQVGRGNTHIQLVLPRSQTL